MKTLKESILSSSEAGVAEIVNKWLTENFSGLKYTIKNVNEVYVANKGYVRFSITDDGIYYIRNGQLVNVPKYIKFINFDGGLSLAVQSNVTVWPNNFDNLQIFSRNCTNYPALNISCVEKFSSEFKQFINNMVHTIDMTKKSNGNPYTETIKIYDTAYQLNKHNIQLFSNIDFGQKNLQITAGDSYNDSILELDKIKNIKCNILLVHLTYDGTIVFSKKFDKTIILDDEMHYISNDIYKKEYEYFEKFAKNNKINSFIIRTNATNYKKEHYTVYYKSKIDGKDEYTNFINPYIGDSCFIQKLN
jgi:hypothetical protein